MKYAHSIGPGRLTLEQVKALIDDKHDIGISTEAKENIIRCREYLDRKLDENNELIYGINTGFGSLSDVQISEDQIETLQKNLVLSHACGTGERVPKENHPPDAAVLKSSPFPMVIPVFRGTRWKGCCFFTMKTCCRLFTRQGSLGASGDFGTFGTFEPPTPGDWVKSIMNMPSEMQM